MHARAAYSFALHAVFFISIVDLSKQRERERDGPALLVCSIIINLKYCIKHLHYFCIIITTNPPVL